MEPWVSAGHVMPLDFGGPADVRFDRFEESWISRPLIERFDKIALQYADRPAVADGTTILTYGEVRRRAYCIAERINAMAAPARPVGILMPHNALFPVAALACLAAGHPYVPIDLKFPDARIEAIIREAGLAAVILDASDAARLVPDDVERIDFRVPALSVEKPPMAAASADSPAVILYTSGSTGKPKGICNSQSAILQRVAEATNSAHIHVDDRVILLSSPGTIAGVREMFTALLNGATLHVTDPQKDGVHSVLNTMAESRITIAYAVPSLLRMLLRLPGANEAFAHMRVMRVGGDITLDSDLARFRAVAPPACHFFASFSSTETPAVFQWFVPPDWQTTGPRVPIGYPRPGIDFMVVGEDGQPAPVDEVGEVGEIGELIVRSRFLAMGQWQHGHLSPGPFMTDPDDPSMRILRTGDMVKLRPDGLWELVGRKDRQVKIRGLRIDAGEVEAALRSSSSVMDVAVIARRSGEEVTALAAFVAPPEPLDPLEAAGLLAELNGALSARVPQYMHPADIRLVDAIPQLPGFKPDIRALEKRDREELERAALQRETINEGISYPTPLQKTAADSRVREAVRHAWSLVLDARSFHENRPWNETNGDSLKAMELWFYIEDKLGFKLPLDALDEDTTPSRLVGAIESHLAGTERRADQEGLEVPVVFLMPGIQGDDPALARFRAAFGTDVCFRITDYPGWRQTIAAGGGFDAIADVVFARICAEPACSVYRLAGYSFGGIVAFEVAQRLVKSGRHVGFVGLLDSRRWDLTLANRPKAFHTFLGEPSRWQVDWVKWAIAMLMRHRCFTALGGMERFLMRHPGKLAFWFSRQLAKELRGQALRTWTPAPLDVPTTLFLSDEHWPDEPDDYGWGRVCSRLTKVHVGGTHATIIQPPQRDALCINFLQALTCDPYGPGDHARAALSAA